MRSLRLAPLALLVACAHAPPAAPMAPFAPNAATAAEFVQALAAEATAGHVGVVESAVDRAFAERLPSGIPLDSIFLAPPTGCRARYVEGGGYEAIAIPPPMEDDDEAETARIQAIVDELQASTEVTVTCEPVQDSDGYLHVIALYAVALRRDDDGHFRVLAWRDFRDERNDD